VKYLDEYRDAKVAKALVAAILEASHRKERRAPPWVVMEVCGGQTHSIVKYGLDELIEDAVELVHGPGCPVCVTSLEMIDRAHAIATRSDVIFCTFGDMARVPGSTSDLLSLRAAGADIRIVYSPLDVVRLATEHPDKHVVFFAIGFETTAPANAMAVWVAKRRGVDNLSALVSHVLVPPAVSAIASHPENRVQAFLAPGHVCTVMGTGDYDALVERFRVPIVVTGFEPVDLLTGVLSAVRQLEAGEAKLENAYARVVKAEGNVQARKLVSDVFEVTDRKWRGVGEIPGSGFRLREGYARLDAEKVFSVGNIETRESPECISGQVLRGVKKPSECPAFGTRCTPERPLGATMVSSEGACAAYFAYGRAPRSPEAARHLPLAAILP
jgi:hydrogenase expression/formation protein HypD